MPRLCTRRGTAQQWYIANPVLLENEVGYEYDTNKYKLGNGIDRWNDLNYSVDQDGLNGIFQSAGYTNLLEFTNQTPWTVFYVDGNGDVKEIALGANGTVLKSNGETVAPSFGAGGGGGDALVSGTLDQFANVTQTAGQTLAINSSTVLAGGTHSGTNTGDQNLAPYLLINGNTQDAILGTVSIHDDVSDSNILLEVVDGTFVVGGVGYLTGTEIASAYQPKDADLTALAALTGTNNIYYRSAANTWTSVTIGTGLSFSTGTLSIGSLTKAELDTAVSDGNVVYVGDALNGTIGATTPAAGTFTTIVANAATSILVGTAGSAVGSVGFRNATSGTITLQPTTGALGTVTITLPAFTGTAVVAATSTTTTQALFATATAGAPAFRAIVAGDIPTLNQNTTGSAATLTTTRTIGGSNFNGSANVTSFPSPGAIGGTTPAAGTFTTLVAGSPTSILVGTAGTSLGSVGFRNVTSGTITIQPTTGALGTVTITMPAFTGTMVVAATSTTTTQALFATATAGAPAFRAIAAGDIPTLNQNTTGSAATLTTPRNIGGTSFNGSADITPANTTVANEAADTLCYITFVTDTTGNLQQKTNAALTFNAATASLGCTTFVGAFTGTASGNLPLTGGTLSGSVRHTETVNNISANAATITLNSGNHQTLDLTSATGDVTITVTVPTGSSSGTIIVKQDNPVRDILWTGATIKWMGVEPQWNLDPVSSIRIISWRYDGTTVYMSATEIAI